MEGRRRQHHPWCRSGECAACAGGTAVLFAGIDPGRLATIQHAIDTCRLERGAVVYPLGSPGEAIYTVRSGVIKLLQYLPDGNQRIVRLVGESDVMGLEALLGEPCQHEAVVERSAEVCRIPVAVVHRLEREEPRLYRELMVRWQRALSEADAWLTELSTGSARQRIARLLLRLVDGAGVGRCPLFGRRDIAAMLGLTTETVSRLIAEFRREGLLQEESDGFCCPVAALQRVAAD